MLALRTKPHHWKVPAFVGSDWATRSGTACPVTPGTSMLMAWRTPGKTSAVAASLLQTWRGTSLTARQASSKLGGSPWLILLFSKKHERAKVRERQRERERERLLCEPTSNCSCIGFGLRRSEQEGLLSVSYPVPGQRPMMKSSGSTCEAARSHLCLAPYLSVSSRSISANFHQFQSWVPEQHPLERLAGAPSCRPGPASASVCFTPRAPHAIHRFSAFGQSDVAPDSRRPGLRGLLSTTVGGSVNRL